MLTKFHIQFFRYGIVGIISNGVLYFLYLLITWLGMEYKLAMTLLYIVGLLQTYIFNRKWTFEHRGLIEHSLPRYIFTYVTGYIFQYSALTLFVDYLGYPHQVVMAIVILLNAALIFLMQKYWVFANRIEVQTK